MDLRGSAFSSVIVNWLWVYESVGRPIFARERFVCSDWFSLLFLVMALAKVPVDVSGVA